MKSQTKLTEEIYKSINDKNLTIKLNWQITEFLLQYKDLYVGQVRGWMKHPIVTRSYYKSKKQDKKTIEYINKMLKEYIIQISDLQYSSEPVIITKTNGELWFCINFK